ncbi:MAG: selenide, water dikinase SelD [Chitinivibrionales bacterium]|nr:selenide, water dikinase SelD [Chitinivibrionales bacterium]
MSFDLLTTVEYGGCSAKLPPGELAQALADLHIPRNEQVLVDITTHDDAGVYKINDECALVQTTDFFPPVCSDPYEFGQIAAANALSDVFAMGGEALTALNLVMFPHTRIPLSVLKEILAGGMDKVAEAGAVIVGGHTIDDFPPKYGLAVTGRVHPQKIATNDKAQPGETLVLAKPLGTGVIIAGRRIGEAKPDDYQLALGTMKQLNRSASAIMQQYGIRCATDITGFSLLGHALKMAQASDVALTIDAESAPLLNGSYELVELGCIPGASFRNLKFIENDTIFSKSVDYNRKMLLCDAQTSGGLLMSVPAGRAETIVQKLREKGYAFSAAIGSVGTKQAQTCFLEVI